MSVISADSLDFSNLLFAKITNTLDKIHFFGRACLNYIFF